MRAYVCIIAIAAGALAFVAQPAPAAGETRIALLIGNQGYSGNVGPLKNPHNDIALVGAALDKLGFKTTLIKDAGYKAIDTALKLHIQNVRKSGKDTISFFYYSGHGAANPENRINYLIPVDVANADDTQMWLDSFELTDIIDKLRSQSPNATHYVVFDACRDELQLTRQGKKALGSEKGFLPVSVTSGVMIAYATAPGRTASDAGALSGPYAKALAEEIVRPGLEAVTMFRNVQLKVQQAIGQDPWLSFPTLPAVYFAGAEAAAPVAPPPVPLSEAAQTWAEIRKTNNLSILEAFNQQFGDTVYGAMARVRLDVLKRQQVASAPPSQETPAQPPAAQTSSIRQIRLVEKHLDGFIAAQKELAAVAEKMQGSASDKPDPKLQAELEGIAKKHGFASFAEYDDVAANISMVMAGIDPQSRAFTEPRSAIQKEIDEVKNDKSIPDKEKKQMLDELGEALKSAQPMQYASNIELVKKYYDKIDAVLQ